MGINLRRGTSETSWKPVSATFFQTIDHEGREVLLLLEERIPRSRCAGRRHTQPGQCSDPRMKRRFGFREERCKGIPVLHLKVRPPRTYRSSASLISTLRCHKNFK